MTREGIKTEKPKLESGIFATEEMYIDKNECSLWVERDRSLTKLCLLVNTVISMALASMVRFLLSFQKIGYLHCAKRGR